MRFSRVSIIGTLAATVLALLVILPVWAADGTDTVGLTGDTLTIRVTDFGHVDATGAGQPDAAETADTRLGRVTYVSNQPDRADDTTRPANTVFVEVAFPPAVTGIQDTEMQTAARNDYVKVRSSSGDSITLEGFAAGGDSDFFRVITPGASVPIRPDDGNADTDGAVQVLEALDGDTITITAGQNVLKLTVDGAGPVITDTSPAHGRLQDSSSTTIGFIVTDSGSGLRTEAEDAGDTDNDRDGDGSSAEPLTDGTAPSSSTGAAVDIDVNWADTANHEARGSRNWEEVEKDKSYSLSYGLAALTSRKYSWYVEAYDRVGNYTRTDSNAGKAQDQDFELTVDNKAPAVSKRFAGIGFDPDLDDGKGGETEDSSSILVIFGNEDALNTVDALDSSTIDADDFVVVGNEIVSVIHPNKKQSVDKQKMLTQERYTVRTGDKLIGTMLEPTVADAADATGENFALLVWDTSLSPPALRGVPEAADGTEYEIAVNDVILNWPLPSAAAKDDTCDSHTGLDSVDGREIEPVESNGYNGSGCIDTRNRVYLVLSSPLEDDAKPEVQLRGGSISDRAGNGNRSSEAKAANRIPPTLAVAVSGDVDTDGRPLAQERISIDITSGERLLGIPQVWLAEFDQDAKITTWSTGSVVVEGTAAMNWSVRFSGNDETKVAAILVRGRDTDQNVVTGAGWSETAPAAQQKLDLAKIEKAGLLVEFDNGIPYAKADVTLNRQRETKPWKRRAGTRSSS